MAVGLAAGDGWCQLGLVCLWPSAGRPTVVEWVSVAAGLAAGGGVVGREVGVSVAVGLAAGGGVASVSVAVGAGPAVAGVSREAGVCGGRLGGGTEGVAWT